MSESEGDEVSMEEEGGDEGGDDEGGGDVLDGTGACKNKEWGIVLDIVCLQVML
jgi:hypothetical protein